MIKRLTYILFLVTIPVLLAAQQELSRYPIRFTQYYNNISAINPAATCANNRVEAAVGNKRLMGNFSKISTYYFSVGSRIEMRKRRNNSPFSVVGIMLYNDREGKYLNRSRFYATYGWHGNITRNLMVSGAFHLGGMNYSVKGTPLTGDGSDTSPDGIIGVQLYNNDFSFGIAYNQIFNSQIRPLEEVARLAPFVNVVGRVKLHLSSDVIAEPVFASRISTNGDKMLTDATAILTYKNIVKGVVGVHNNNKMLYAFELHGVLDKLPDLNIAVSYSHPTKKSGIKTNIFEVGLGYTIQ